MKTYHADVARDGKFWLISIPELGRSTQARRYKDVSAMASDLVEIMTGLGADDFDLHLNVHLPAEVQDHLARAEVLREEAKRKNAEAKKESHAAVRELLAQGLSQREAADLLDVSFQRVNQLAKPC